MLEKENHKNPSLQLLKNHFLNLGYEFSKSTGRGVYADFVLKIGNSKRDPVEIIDVNTNPVPIKISQITNEKRYIFNINGQFYSMRGKTLERQLNGKSILIDQIKNSRELKLPQF